MASKYLQKYPVPAGFQEILSDFTREVLRDQPTNVIEYAARYFEMKEKGEKFQFDSKYNVSKDDKKYELSYNPKNAQEITKKATNIASKMEAEAPSQKTVNEQEVENMIQEQPAAIINQDVDEVVSELFDEFDKNSNGFLQKEQIYKLVESAMGKFDPTVKPTEEDIKEFMVYVDENSDGKISKKEFINFIKKYVMA